MYVSRLLFHTIPGKPMRLTAAALKSSSPGSWTDYLGKLAHHYGHSGSSGGSVR
jgi:hypothetical protein